MPVFYPIGAAAARKNIGITARFRWLCRGLPQRGKILVFRECSWYNARVNVFSTCYFGKKFKDGNSLCDAVRELGFDTIEASHGLPLSLLPGIISSVEEGRIKVAGVHNFCPAPMEVPGDAPDFYRFTSHRAEDRERAMRLTQETLQVAQRLGARYVVLHMGEVELFRGHHATHTLERMVRHGYLSTHEYAVTKGDIVRKRTKLAPLYVERARAALHELAELARPAGLVLGVEGRSHLEQVPGEAEMLRLMEEFKDDPAVMYWHDFGHIQRKHNLRLLNHDRYLRTLAPYLYGAHINDVQWPQRDHRAPFFGGDVDFDTLLPRYFSQDMPLTWELSSSVRPEDIQEAKERWDALMPSLPATRDERGV